MWLSNGWIAGNHGGPWRYRFYTLGICRLRLRLCWQTFVTSPFSAYYAKRQRCAIIKCFSWCQDVLLGFLGQKLEEEMSFPLVTWQLNVDRYPFEYHVDDSEPAGLHLNWCCVEHIPVKPLQANEEPALDIRSSRFGGANRASRSSCSLCMSMPDFTVVVQSRVWDVWAGPLFCYLDGFKTLPDKPWLSAHNMSSAMHLTCSTCSPPCKTGHMSFLAGAVVWNTQPSAESSVQRHAQILSKFLISSCQWQLPESQNTATNNRPVKVYFNNAGMRIPPDEHLFWLDTAGHGLPRQERLLDLRYLRWTSGRFLSRRHQHPPAVSLLINHLIVSIIIRVVMIYQCWSCFASARHANAVSVQDLMIFDYEEINFDRIQGPRITKIILMSTLIDCHIVCWHPLCKVLFVQLSAGYGDYPKRSLYVFGCRTSACGQPPSRSEEFPTIPFSGVLRCATADASSSTQLCIVRSGMETDGNLPQVYPNVLSLSFIEPPIRSWCEGLACTAKCSSTEVSWMVMNGRISICSEFIVVQVMTQGDRDDLLFVLVFLTGTGPLCSQARIADVEKSAMLGRPHISDTTIVVTYIYIYYI